MFGPFQELNRAVKMMTSEVDDHPCQCPGAEVLLRKWRSANISCDSRKADFEFMDVFNDDYTRSHALLLDGHLNRLGAAPPPRVWPNHRASTALLKVTTNSPIRCALLPGFVSCPFADSSLSYASISLLRGSSGLLRHLPRVEPDSGFF
jgi:hypothetical protein